MQSPTDEMRALRDQLIKTINHKMFDDSDDAAQQGFLRKMGQRMNIGDDAMNAIMRQSWDKRGPVPVLRPVPVVASPPVIAAGPTPMMAQIRLPGEPKQFVASGLRTPLNDIFKINFRDLTPAEFLTVALATQQNQGPSVAAINSHFQKKAEPGYHQIFIPQLTLNLSGKDETRVYYIDPQKPYFGVKQTISPLELNRPSIAVDQQPVHRVNQITDVPGYFDDIGVFLAYIDGLRAHVSVLRNMDAQQALTTIRRQIEEYARRVRVAGQFNQWEYITNMRGWRDQLTILGREMEATQTNRIIPVTATAQPAAPVPGALLPNFFQTFRVAAPVGGLAPSAMGNIAELPQVQQPLSPTASRLAVPFTTFTPNQPVTFVNQKQQIYLTQNSKENEQIKGLHDIVDRLWAEEKKQPVNTRPSYIGQLRDLSQEINLYRMKNASRGINLYKYVGDIQDFTDRLKDLQTKIAARPLARYHPNLDPAILHEPAILQQPTITLNHQNFQDLIAMQRVLTDITQDELNSFGPQGVFIDDLGRMLDDMTEQFQYYRLQARGQVATEEWLGVLRRWRDAIQELIDQRKALGRRCVNDTDPWDGTPVMEIPDNEYIRLSNGMCWHVGSLMEYIRGKEGLNESKGLVGYASQRLWETDDDVKRIVEHPLVKADPDDFARYFMNAVYGWMADRISANTLQMMYTTASMFVSRGQPFSELIKGFLTPEQYGIFMNYTGGDAYKFKLIPVNQQREEIETAITLIMKGKAAVTFWTYYDSLSLEEKEAIRSFRASFETDLRNCRFGKNGKANNKLCVYVMANIILPVVYRVGDLKSLKFEKLNTSET